MHPEISYQLPRAVQQPDGDRPMCTHEPQCPSAGDIARAVAHVIASHPEQGWSLLCNGIVVFDDGGLLLPGGRAAAPHTQPSHTIAA